MTKAQRQAVSSVLWHYAGDDVALDVHAHHGDCVGADAEFHQLCTGFKWWMVGHPSTHNLRAFCDFDETRAPKSPLVRNRDIVQESGVMIATPFESVEKESGGTWRTIKLTRRGGKPLVLVLPDGTVSYERWPT
jgi:hypothetical protein